LIDDDADFRTGLAAMLRDDGHEVQEFCRPNELPALARLPGFDAVITDYRMVGHDGLVFADCFHAVHPTVPVVLITAYWTHHLEAEASRRSFLHLWRKPIDYNELHELLLRQRRAE
jgi:DNA-binding NtrC family response regulator